MASDSLYVVAWQFYGSADAWKPFLMPVVISLWTPIGSNPVRCKNFLPTLNLEMLYEDDPHPDLRRLAGRRPVPERLRQER